MPRDKPAFLIRQPKHLLVLWLLVLASQVGLVLAADGMSWQMLAAPPIAGVAAYEIAKNFLASIRVGPEQIVFKGVHRVETIDIDDFVGIERHSLLQLRRPFVVTTTGTTWAPWWHPNLAAAIKVAIADVKSELAN